MAYACGMPDATELRDPALVAAALRAAGVGFEIEQDDVVMTEGPATVTVDLKTGSLTGDVEAMAQKLGLVRQLYAEAKYRAECQRQGIDVLHRTVGDPPVWWTFLEADKRKGSDPWQDANDVSSPRSSRPMRLVS